MPRGAQRVPSSFAIDPFVLGYIFRQCVEWPVGGGVGHIEEERIAGLGGLFDHLGGLVADGIGVIVGVGGGGPFSWLPNASPAGTKESSSISE